MLKPRATHIGERNLVAILAPARWKRVFCLPTIFYRRNSPGISKTPWNNSRRHRYPQTMMRGGRERAGKWLGGDREQNGTGTGLDVVGRQRVREFPRIQHLTGGAERGNVEWERDRNGNGIRVKHRTEGKQIEKNKHKLAEGKGRLDVGGRQRAEEFPRTQRPTGVAGGGNAERERDRNGTERD
jgi:hypothetical protein